MLGKPVRRPSKLDKRLVRELKALADPEDPYDTITGTTMCANDFYEGTNVFKKSQNIYDGFQVRDEPMGHFVITQKPKK